MVPFGNRKTMENRLECSGGACSSPHWFWEGNQAGCEGDKLQKIQKVQFLTLPQT